MPFKCFKKQIRSNRGFSIIEVAIAFLAFATFFLVFVQTQSDNRDDSFFMAKELDLNHACEEKINEILLDPPQFNSSLTLAPKTGRFENKQFADYSWKIEYKRFEIPNFFELQKEAEAEGEANAGAGGLGGNQANLLSGYFETIKRNIKEAIWQVRVEVQDRTDESKCIHSMWIRNENAEFNFGRR